MKSRGMTNHPVRRRFDYLTGMILCAVSIIAAGGAPGVCRAADTSDFKYFKLVQMPGIQASQLVYIRLDDEIYKFSEPGYTDVRVFTSKKEEIPRLIEREMTGNAPRKEDYEPVEVNARYDEGARRAVIDIAMNRQPVTAFEPVLDTGEITGDVTVEVRNDTGWKELDTDAGLTFEETRGREYRIVIEDVDPPGVTVRTVRAIGNSYRIVYSAAAGTAFQLFWGAEDVPEPRYDRASIRDALALGKPIKRARVGRGFANPDHGRTAGTESSGFVNSRWFFIILIVLVLFLVLSALAKAVRKQEK